MSESQTVLSKYLHNKAGRLGIPFSGTFEVTPVCNMNCRMCYVTLSKEKQESISPLKSAEEWLTIAEKAKNEGLLYLLVTGGEPFLYPQIKELAQGFSKMGIVYSINSNGTLINEETISWLKTCPPAKINITLYGASDETYLKLCRNPHGFTQVTNAVKLLKEAGIMFRFNCSLTPYNKDDLEEMIAYAKSVGAQIRVTSYMFPPLRKSNENFGKNDGRFSPDQAAYYDAKAKYLIYGKETFLESIRNRKYLADYSLEECEDHGDALSRCRAGKSSFWITWEGKMLFCGMVPNNDAPNVFEKEFMDCWKEVKDYTRQIRLSSKCAECKLNEICHSCASEAYCETGRFSGVPEYKCQMSQAYLPSCLRICEENGLTAE